MKFSKPDTKNSENLPVRLVLCFDGTGDTASGSFGAVDGTTVGTRDSIKTIFDMTKAGPVTDSSGKKAFQYVQYFEGVATVGVSDVTAQATQETTLFDSASLAIKEKATQAKALFDGATGNGYLDILRNGYKVCCQQLQHDDKTRHEIFIFGFSRGAFISRALASFLQHVGLIKAEYLDESKDELFQQKFRELLVHYMTATVKSSSWVSWGSKTEGAKDSTALPSFCIPSPRVRLLGAFDTVKTVIPLPMHNFFSGRLASIDFQMDAPGLVDHFRHALALNEQRPLFNPDLWNSGADSPDSSYLEAWFFGFHHDIGGGDDVQGLALWPLQWILHAASDCGLALDPNEEPYDILFTGADNVIETPHEIAMKMYDMIRYHTETKSWGLRLNQPFSLMAPRPREFFHFLTKPPYVQFLKPKVFVHPSAYLVFDVSSSFRLQVYQWKHFRKFLNDRFHALPQTATPWWEKETVASILREATAVERLNLLVIGRPKTGKSSMLKKIFGLPSELTGAGKGIEVPVCISGNNKVRVHYSDGFGHGGSDDRASIAKFLESHRNNPDVDSRIHAIWYFVDSAEEIPDSEQELFKMDFGEIPVLAILQNEEKLRDRFREDNVDAGYRAEVIAQKMFEEAITKLKDSMTSLPVRKYVQARNKLEAPKNLLTETAVFFDNESIQLAQIKAQRIEVKPKIALATEETVRAFTIWHEFKSTGIKHSFNRNKDPAGMPLSRMLMEPVLATFSMGFTGDAELIQSRIGAPWQALDKYKSGLWDTSLPGDLILICMLDTVIVMTHAVAHQKGAKSSKEEARALCPEEVEKACAWYTKDSPESAQVALHKAVRELLTSDGTPKDGSVANLQMKIIEAVELHSDVAEKAPEGVLQAAFTDAVSGVVGWFGRK